MSLPPSFCFVYSDLTPYGGCFLRSNLVLTCADCVKNANTVQIVTDSFTINATKLYILNEIALIELSTNSKSMLAILNTSTIQPGQDLFTVKNYAEGTTTVIKTRSCFGLKICNETTRLCPFQSGIPLYKDIYTVYGLLSFIDGNCSDLSVPIIDISNYITFISDVIENKVTPTKVLGQNQTINLMYESNCNIYTNFEYINNNSGFYNTYYLGKTLLSPTDYTVNPNNDFNPYTPIGTDTGFSVKLGFFDSPQYNDFINEYAKITKGEVMFVYKYPNAKVPYAKIDLVNLTNSTKKVPADNVIFQVYTFETVQPVIDNCTKPPTTLSTTTKPPTTLSPTTMAPATKVLSPGEIAGIVIGSIVGFILILLFLFS